MPLELHDTYTQDEAIAFFPGTPVSFCDNQFVVLSEVILCFITVGDSADRSQLRSPSEVRWVPGRIDYALDEEYPWLPHAVRETHDRRGPKSQRLYGHHLFLRAHYSASFYYAGEVHLGSYGSFGTQLAANFSIKTKLPRPIWLV